MYFFERTGRLGMKVCVNYILINKRYTLVDSIVCIILKCDNYFSLLKVIYPTGIQDIFQRVYFVIRI